MEQGNELVVEQVEVQQQEPQITELSHEILDRIGGGTVLMIL